MARYTTTQTTGWDPDTAFAWMADLRHLAVWDPSITTSEQVAGDGPGPGAEYDVTVHAAGGERSMHYRVEEWEPAERRLLAVSETPVLTSYDRISVEALDGGGAAVTYDADLVMKGPAKLADPLVGVGFGRMGDTAATGLADVLHRPTPPE
ncbi:MAG TPA: SRPBCC family protein [Iamia sp.]|nr:SRPBCC family protein [Iamia sp.]